MNREELLNRMRGINAWISENPDVTEPNMYEMIDCVTQLGVIAREQGVGDMPGKFPAAGSELAELYDEWNKMYRARLSWDKVQSPDFSVNKNTALYSYFTELNMRCCTGEFRYPEGVAERKEFLECCKKIGSVSLYINQQRLANPNFVYDNQTEFRDLEDMAERYEQYLPAYSDRVISDISASRTLEQPQNPGGDDEPSL